MFRAVRLDDERLGMLWLHAMPGRLESWPRFVQEAEQARLSLVVCLTPRHEIAQLSPSYLEAIEHQALPFRWLHLPMRDLGLAPQFETFRAGVDDARDVLQSQQNVLVHCAAGIGRTGTLAACLLKRLRLPTPVALERVREAGSSPESALQGGLVEKF
jgi:protein-tyrosine phosphatase